MNVDLSEQDTSKHTFMNRRYQKEFLKNIFPSGFLGSSSKAIDASIKERAWSTTLNDSSLELTLSTIGLHAPKSKFSYTSWTKGEESPEEEEETNTLNGFVKDSYANVAGGYRYIVFCFLILLSLHIYNFLPLPIHFLPHKQSSSSPSSTIAMSFQWSLHM